MKRTVSFVLSIVLILSTLVCTTGAVNYKRKGNYRYIVERNTVTITEYLGKETDVVIPDNIKGIKVAKIDDSAFIFCSSIKSVVIPETVKMIDSSAFYDCSALEKVSLPKNLEVIGNSAFEFCKSLQEFNLGNKIKEIGNEAFKDTAFIKNEKNWENGTLYCGKYLLGLKDTGMKTFSVKEGTRIVDGAIFKDFKNLESVYFPKSVISIGDDSNLFFWNCPALKKIVVDKENKKYMSKNGVLFDKEKKTIYRYPSSKSGKTYNVPKSVELIVSGAFEGCRNLETVNFNKDSTALIDGLAFYNCFKIKTMTFPKKIRLLDDGDPPIGCYFVSDDDEYAGRIDKQVDGFSVKGYKNSSAEWICSVYCFKFTSLCKDGKEHKTVKRKAKKATYFEDGNKAYEFCTVCGEWINYRKIPRLQLAYPRLIEIKGEKSAIKVKCNAGKDATGFQVRYFNEDGKKVTKTFSSDGAKTVRIKGLKSGEYRVRVRGFVKSGKKVAYSSWSSSRYITVK